MIPRTRVQEEPGLINSQEPQKTEEQNWAGHLGYSSLNSGSPNWRQGFQT